MKFAKAALLQQLAKAWDIGYLAGREDARSEVRHKWLSEIVTSPGCEPVAAVNPYRVGGETP